MASSCSESDDEVLLLSYEDESEESSDESETQSGTGDVASLCEFSEDTEVVDLPSSLQDINRSLDVGYARAYDECVTDHSRKEYHGEGVLIKCEPLQKTKHVRHIENITAVTEDQIRLSIMKEMGRDTKATTFEIMTKLYSGGVGGMEDSAVDTDEGYMEVPVKDTSHSLGVSFDSRNDCHTEGMQFPLMIKEEFPDHIEQRIGLDSGVRDIESIKHTGAFETREESVQHLDDSKEGPNNCDENITDASKGHSEVTHLVCKSEEDEHVPNVSNMLSVSIEDEMPNGTKYPNKEKLIETDNTIYITNKTLPEVNRFSCDICQELLSTRESLKLHMLFHKSKDQLECLECGHAFRKLSELKEHMKDHTIILPCPTKSCKEIFTTVEAKADHVTKCHSFLFSCLMCKDYSFRYPSQHRIHMRENHPGVKNIYHCWKCFDSFSSFKKYQRHIRLTHYKVDECDAHDVVIAPVVNKPGECPRYSCPVCGKGFQLFYPMIRHLIAHQRPVRCLDCMNVYVTYAALKNHAKQVHKKRNPTLLCYLSISGNKIYNMNDGRLPWDIIAPETYMCLDCEKQFTRYQTLKYHALQDHRRKYPSKAHYVSMRESIFHSMHDEKSKSDGTVAETCAEESDHNKPMKLGQMQIPVTTSVNDETIEGSDEPCKKERLLVSGQGQGSTLDVSDADRAHIQSGIIDEKCVTALSGNEQQLTAVNVTPLTRASDAFVEIGTEDEISNRNQCQGDKVCERHGAIVEHNPSNMDKRPTTASIRKRKWPIGQYTSGGTSPPLKLLSHDSQANLHIPRTTLSHQLSSGPANIFHSSDRRTNIQSPNNALLMNLEHQNLTEKLRATIMEKIHSPKSSTHRPHVANPLPPQSYAIREKQHCCKVCNKQFFSSSALRVHMFTHKST